MRKQSPKRELTLMTLLANEATKESRALLRKYKRPDAKGYSDLELKLAELYTSIPDKFILEKEMAEIHPHKKWLIKRLELEKPKEIQLEEVAVKSEKAPSNNFYCNNPYCPTHGNVLMCEYSNANGITNNPYASTQGKPNTQITDTQTIKSPADYVGLIGVLAIVGMTLYVITKVK